MRILDWFRKVTSSRQHNRLGELYRSSEQGTPLPEVTAEAREQFEADQRLIDQFSELAPSVGPTDAAQQRDALLSRVAEQRKGRRVEEGIPLFGRLFQKRTLVAAGAAVLLLGAAATVGAAGGVSDVAGSVDDVLAALQLTAGESNVEICHVPDDNPDNPHTISVGESAVEDHVAHGDTEGACADESSPSPPDNTGPSDSAEVCHSPADNPDNAHTISVPENALDEHIAHGDTEGACADESSPGPPDSTGPSDSTEVCHSSADNPDNAHTISVPGTALAEHLAHGDTEGACADESSPGAPDSTGPSDKVELCHASEDNPDNAHTISVPESAVEEHLAHGDEVGACSETGPSGEHAQGPPDGVPPVDPPADVPQGPPSDRPPVDVPQGPPDGVPPVDPPADVPQDPPTDRPPFEVPQGPPEGRPPVEAPPF